MNLLKALTYQHPEHERYSSHWQLLAKMVQGGATVSNEIKEVLLANPDRRPSDLVRERRKITPYTNLIGTILRSLQSQLLAKEATYTAETSDSFLIKEFINGGCVTPHSQSRVSFHSFLEKAILQALIQGKAIAQVDTTIAGDEPYVLLRKREELWDWKIDNGGFAFAKLHTFRLNKETWDSSPIPEHDFLIYQRRGDNSITATRYLIRTKVFDEAISLKQSLDSIDSSQAQVELILPETEIFHVIKGNEKIFRFPLEVLSLPPLLWLGDQLFDAQKSFLNHTASLEWALMSTNYAQLIFEDVDDEQELQARLGLAGNGYWWALPPDVRAKWLEREGRGIELAMSYRDILKQEMFDVIHTIAFSLRDRGVAIRRSGESKREDRRNFDILLELYGQYLREFAKLVLDTVSIARGEISDWRVRGFYNYDSDSLVEDLNEWLQVDKAIGSPSFHQAGRKQIAAKAVTTLGLPKSLLGKIEGEIEQIETPLNDEFPPVSSPKKR